MKHQDARKLHPRAQEALRYRIVDFLKKGKGPQQQAASIFQVSVGAIEKYGSYLNKAVKSIKAKEAWSSKKIFWPFRAADKVDQQHYPKRYA